MRSDVRERDEGDLRWFWNRAAGDLGLSGSGDFEGAAQARRVYAPRCERCTFAGGAADPQWHERRRRADPQRRARRSRCGACLGLGVVVPTTYPSGNEPSSPSWVDPWLGLFQVGNDPLVSAKPPTWSRMDDARVRANRKKHLAIHLALQQMDAGHVMPLWATLGPAPSEFEHGDDVPEAALILAAMNRNLPENRVTAIRQRLKGDRVDRFTDGSARQHVDRMLIAPAWRAYDRARGRVVNEEREPIVEACKDADRVLPALLRVVEEERASGVWLRPSEVARAELPGAGERVAE